LPRWPDASQRQQVQRRPLPDPRRGEIPDDSANGRPPTGFFQNDTFGNHGANYGWGIATCIVRTSHDGAAAMLSPGSFGHGGAWGTQAWIDLVKGVAYVLMVQLSIDSPDIRELGVRADVLVLSSVLI